MFIRAAALAPASVLAWQCVARKARLAHLTDEEGNTGQNLNSDGIRVHSPFSNTQTHPNLPTLNQRTDPDTAAQVPNLPYPEWEANWDGKEDGGWWRGVSWWWVGGGK